METTAPRLVRSKDIEERLGVHRVTVMRLAERGYLRKVKIGGAVRFYAEDVNALIERGTVTPKKGATPSGQTGRAREGRTSALDSA